MEHLTGSWTRLLSPALLRADGQTQSKCPDRSVPQTPSCKMRAGDGLDSEQWRAGTTGSFHPSDPGPGHRGALCQVSRRSPRSPGPPGALGGAAGLVDGRRPRGH